VGVTTLEEVFLKVGDGIIPGYDRTQNSLADQNEQMIYDEYSISEGSVTGFALTML